MGGGGNIKPCRRGGATQNVVLLLGLEVLAVLNGGCKKSLKGDARGFNLS